MFRPKGGVKKFPLVPGHEIAGVVRAVGANVTRFQVGDHAAVGCHVYSCRACDECQAGLEQHCKVRGLNTYASVWPEGIGHDECAGHFTNGGYSTDIVVDAHFVYPVPAAIPLQFAAPLMCAGITTFVLVDKKCC